MVAIIWLLALLGVSGTAYGVYAMIHGGRDYDDSDGRRGGLGPIPERGIHVLAGLRITIFGLLCLAAAAFALTRI